MTPERAHTIGIRDIDGLRDRCVVDDITGCWIWALGFDRRWPKVTFVAPDTGAVVWARGRRAALYLARGKDLPKGHVAYARLCCDNDKCCNPAHARSGSRSEWGQWLAASAQWKGLPSKILAAQKTRDRCGRNTSPEQLDLIRQGRGEESLSAFAKRIGVGRMTVWRVEQGLAHNGPTQVPGASVWSWRGQGVAP